MTVTHLDARRARSAWAAALLLTLAAYGLRLYRLNAQSLWLDEVITYYRATSLFNSSRPYAQFAAQTRHWFYGLSMLSSVTLVGKFGLRWPSVLAGTLSVAVMYRVATRLAGRRAGLLAALLLGFSTMHLYYSQEARQYAFVLLMSLTSLWAMIELVDDTRWSKWLYPVSVALVAALHVLAALWLAVQSAFLLVYARRHRVRYWPSWAVAQFALGAVLLLIYVLETSRGLRGPKRLAAPDLNAFEQLFRFAIGLRVGVRDIPPFTLTSLFGLPTPVIQPRPAQVFLPLLVSYGLFCMVSRRDASNRPLTPRSIAVLLVLLTTVPPLVAFALSHWWRPMFVPRYLFPSVGSFFLLLAVSTSALRPRLLRMLIPVMVVTSSLLGNVRYYFDPYFQRQNWRGAAAYIVEHERPDDALFVMRRPMTVPLFYYLGDSIQLDFLFDPTAWDEDEAESKMCASSRSHERVWIVWSRSPAIDDWMAKAAPAAVLLDHADFNRVQVYLYTGDLC